MHLQSLHPEIPFLAPVLPRDYQSPRLPVSGSKCPLCEVLERCVLCKKAPKNSHLLSLHCPRIHFKENASVVFGVTERICIYKDKFDWNQPKSSVERKRRPAGKKSVEIKILSDTNVLKLGVGSQLCERVTEFWASEDERLILISPASWKPTFYLHLLQSEAAPWNSGCPRVVPSHQQYGQWVDSLPAHVFNQKA
jgi:hypothetical protein